MKKYVGFFSFVLIISTAYSQTNIPSGDVYGTWTAAGSPYNIQGDITIPDDSTLTIGPGVSIVFQGHYALYVLGRLLAIGTDVNRITFTVNDTTGFSNPDTNLGGWYGIRFIDTPQDNDTSKISYCNLQYGKAVGPESFFNAGGAFCILHFDKVIISDCNITHCSAGGPEFAVGGAMAVGWSDIQLVNNVIAYNQADAGGALHFYESDPVLINNVIEYNSAIDGGALDIQHQSHPVFLNDQFSNNSASGNGGAVQINDSSTAVFSGSTISGNYAYYGAGIHAWSSDLQFDSCSLSDNASGWIGGGINAGYCNVNINNTSFERDTAALFGGGMGIYFSELVITNSSLTDNSARVLGGGIHSDYTNINISGTTFERDTSGETGGAVFAWQCQLQIEDCNFTDNSATYNGGAIATDSTSASIIQSNFIQNKAIWGGAMICGQGSINISDNSFVSNSADHGGAVNCNQTDLRLSLNSFEQNSGSWGGVLSVYNSNLTVDSCTFLQNHAFDEAGAIEYMVDTAYYHGPVSLQISKSNFTENVSDNLYAGVKVIQLNSDTALCSVSMDKNKFSGNSANQYSVVRFIGSISEIHINSCFFENNYNTGTWLTSTLSVNGGATVKLVNSVFARNYPRAVAANVNSSIDLMNCTIVNNYGASSAALSLRNNAEASITNSILWNNGDNQVTMVTVNSTETILNINNSDFQYGPDSILTTDSLCTVNWGTGNLDTDPLLADTLNLDIHLDDSSPCIAAGVDSIQVDSIWFVSPPSDFEGNPRPNPAGSMPDIGAFESELSAPIPVELVSFTAALNNGKVILHWTTKTEKNNLGFHVERSSTIAQQRNNWISVGFVKGNGTTTEPKDYSFTDEINGVAGSSLSYRLKQVDFNGSAAYSSEVVVNNPVPLDFALDQNYPNPFNPTTIIAYSISSRSDVTIRIFNVLGKEIAALVNDIKDPGNYTVEFNAAGLSSGIYFYSIKAGDFKDVRKMTLLK